ncbi:PIN domain-containing protein [Rhodobacteraceae bacterium F11138]|nr:PIN domain-containing protein [Rhodobacteraceae bacterium F11138]
MYILDTNVISATRRPDRHTKLATWLHAQREDDLFLSVITIGEIARGVRQQEKLNSDFAVDLKERLNRTETLFQDRILPFTSRDARRVRTDRERQACRGAASWTRIVFIHMRCVEAPGAAEAPDFPTAPEPAYRLTE